MTGCEYLASFLKSRGVTQVFDYPGNCLLPIYPALKGAGITHYTMRSESGAVFAASGVSRSGAGVGVCFATSGPGATNLVTGLADAMLDSVPLVAFTGQVSTKAIGQDAFQEADLLGITLPITKHNFLVKDVKLLPTVLEEAFAVADSARKGPVLVDLPQDVLLAELEDPRSFARLPHKRAPGSDALDQKKDALLSLLSRAHKPLMLVGGGCKGDAKLVRDAIARLHLPCVHTLMGKGVVPDTHPLSFGLIGLHGKKEANELIKACDTLVAVGCRFSDRSLPDTDLLRGKCVLQIDLDRAELSKRFPPALGVRASAREFFSLLKSAPVTPFDSWAAPKKAPAKPDGFCLASALDLLSESFPDAIFVTDVGTHQVLAANAVAVSSPYDFLSSGGLGSMGFGLGAALGAALSHKDRRVVLLVGDGGLQMNLGELASIKEFHSDNLLLVLCDNKALGLVEELNRIQKRPAICPERTNPDFDALFCAFGLDVARANDAVSFKDALNAIGNGRARVLHLSLSPSESAYRNTEENA